MQMRIAMGVTRRRVREDRRTCAPAASSAMASPRRAASRAARMLSVAKHDPTASQVEQPNPEPPLDPRYRLADGRGRHRPRTRLSRTRA